MSEVLEYMRCNYCNRVFEGTNENQTLVDCDICGDHTAYVCPYCNNSVDTVFNSIEKEEYEKNHL